MKIENTASDRLQIAETVNRQAQERINTKRKTLPKIQEIDFTLICNIN